MRNTVPDSPPITAKAVTPLWVPVLRNSRRPAAGKPKAERLGSQSLEHSGVPGFRRKGGGGVLRLKLVFVMMVVTKTASGAIHASGRYPLMSFYLMREGMEVR